MNVHIQTFISRLEFRYPFRIAHGERTGTDVVFVKVECNGHMAFGEATLPPYLPDKISDVIGFFDLPYVRSIDSDFDPVTVFDHLERICPGIMPAKAALDMALWHLKAAMQGVSVSNLLNIQAVSAPPESYTIGVGSKDEMREKLEFGLHNGFHFFKLKLDGNRDAEVIRDFRSLSSLPFAIDANQAWINPEASLELSLLCENQGCVLIEQPFEKADLSKSSHLAAMLKIPVIADEACQRIWDIERIHGAFDGLNIKLQKCGGITEAYRMIKKAKEKNLKVLIGCMSESSIGCNAAAVLAPLCDWVDLDGPFLNRNNDELIASITK